MKKPLISSLLFAGLAAVLSPAQAAGNDFGKAGLSPDYVDPSGRLERLTADGNTLRMGAKKVEFSPGASIGNIRVGREKVLAGPATVGIRAEGKPLPVSGGDVTLKMTGKNAAEAVSTGRFPGGQVLLRVAAGWDHTLHAELTVRPERSLTVDALTLNFPLALGKEKLLTGVAEPPMKVLAGRQAEMLYLRKNIKTKEPLDLSAWHNLWLGNTRCGLAWSFADLKNWNTTFGKEMTFRPEKDLLTINLIDRRTTLSGPVVYKFVMNITPLAKMPPRWRAWKIGTRYNNMIKTAADKLIYWSFWRPGTIAAHNSRWVFDEKKLKEIAAFDAAAGKTRMFYLIPSHYTWSVLASKDGKPCMLVDRELEGMTSRALTVPDYSYRFKKPAGVTEITSLEEWKKLFGGEPPRTRRAGERACRLTRELLERNMEIVQKFSFDYNIPGIYSDGVVPKADFNTAAGAVKDGEGRVRPVYALAEYQELYRRIRAVVTAKDAKKGMMVAHNSAVRFMPSLALFDFVIFGEDFFYWYQDPEKRDASPDGEFYYAHIWGDIDNLKTEFYRQYGQPQVFLPELRGADRKVFPEPARGTRTMLCYTIQFDMLYWPLWCDAGQINAFDAIRQKFGVGGSDSSAVEFIPYWENKKFVPSDPKVKVGYYEKNHAHDPYYPEEKAQSFLLLVSNPEFAKSEFSLALPKEFGNVRVTDSYTQKQVPVKEGKIALALDPFSFAVLELAVSE
ncbi:MAG: hypothetical protein IJS01_08375 [Lentisphaeria bacterium]|nr:hypothetical protein [Lentisphaeria bacterium]